MTNYLLGFLDNLCSLKKLFEDTNLKLYEDETNFYLEFLYGPELVLGNHFFNKYFNIQVSYFNYTYAIDDPNGSWASKVAFISNDRVHFTGKRETKQFPFQQIIPIRKKI